MTEWFGEMEEPLGRGVNGYSVEVYCDPWGVRHVYGGLSCKGQGGSLRTLQQRKWGEEVHGISELFNKDSKIYKRKIYSY